MERVARGAGDLSSNAGEFVPRATTAHALALLFIPQIVIKDETLEPPKKHLRIARAVSPVGPFIALSPPFSPDWVEGPTPVCIGEWTYVYYDRYREGNLRAARSRDLEHREDVSSLISFPPGARHGTVVEVPASMVERIGV